MIRLIEDLYLGDIQHAADTELYKEHGIDDVIQLTHNDPEDGYPDGVIVHQYPMMDGPKNDPDMMQEAVARTIELLSQGSTLMVHCSAGESRSAAVCMAAISFMEDCTMEEAREMVEEAKPVRTHPSVFENAKDVVEGSSRVSGW